MAATYSRREAIGFIGTAGTALVIGLRLPLGAGRGRALAAADATASTGTGQPFEPNAFIRIAQDSSVTVQIKHIEFGQGPTTGLATLVAEELDADWSQMRAELAPANMVYKNLFFGMQGTGGSSSSSSEDGSESTTGEPIPADPVYAIVYDESTQTVSLVRDDVPLIAFATAVLTRPSYSS